MARQESIFVRGKLSNLIFYNFKGKPCVRMMPEKVRQTKATRKSAMVFGKAASMSKALRMGLRPLYRDLDDPSLMQRLNGTMVKYLNTQDSLGTGFQQDLPYLEEFSFNKDHQLSKRLKIYPVVRFDSKGKMKLIFPAAGEREMIIFPAAAGFVRLQLAGVAFDPAEPLDVESWLYESGIESNLDQLKIPSPPFTNRKGQMIVLGASLRYYKTKDAGSMIRNISWMPSGVVAAIWTG